jgi:hypothetical protein
MQMGERDIGLARPVLPSQQTRGSGCWPPAFGYEKAVGTPPRRSHPIASLRSWCDWGSTGKGMIFRS